MKAHSKDFYKNLFDELKIRAITEREEMIQYGKLFAKAVKKSNQQEKFLALAKAEYLEYSKLLILVKAKYNRIKNDPKITEYDKYVVALNIRSFENEIIRNTTIIKYLMQ